MIRSCNQRAQQKIWSQCDEHSDDDPPSARQTHGHRQTRMTSFLRGKQQATVKGQSHVLGVIVCITSYWTAHQHLCQGVHLSWALIYMDPTRREVYAIRHSIRPRSKHGETFTLRMTVLLSLLFRPHTLILSRNILTHSWLNKDHKTKKRDTSNSKTKQNWTPPTPGIGWQKGYFNMKCYAN